MTHDLDSPIGPDDLIAYLDGEVDAQTRQNIDRRLANDPQLVQRMRQHQRAWDLLDELAREEASDDFAQTTLQMVAVAAANDIKKDTADAGTRRVRRWVTAGASLVAASLIGFWATSSLLEQPNLDLLRDLPVIENLEAFQQAGDVDFLRALENEGLFVAEVENEQ